jgi:hypothetical protein
MEKIGGKLPKHLKENMKKQCDIHVFSKRFSTRSFIIGIGCGMALGLMLAIIIINVC